jgi:hypothetical protein
MQGEKIAVKASHAMELLQQLNELEQNYGRVPAERDPNYDPSGEAQAHIQLLKQELADLGVQILWDGWQYRMTGA